MDVPLPGGFDLYVEALIPELQYEAAGERAVREFGTEKLSGLSAPESPKLGGRGARRFGRQGIFSGNIFCFFFA